MIAGATLTLVATILARGSIKLHPSARLPRWICAPLGRRTKQSPCRLKAEVQCRTPEVKGSTPVQRNRRFGGFPYCPRDATAGSLVLPLHAQNPAERFCAVLRKYIHRCNDPERYAVLSIVFSTRRICGLPRGQH